MTETITSKKVNRGQYEYALRRFMRLISSLETGNLTRYWHRRDAATTILSMLWFVSVGKKTTICSILRWVSVGSGRSQTKGIFNDSASIASLRAYWLYSHKMHFALPFSDNALYEDFKEYISWMGLLKGLFNSKGMAFYYQQMISWGEVTLVHYQRKIWYARQHSGSAMPWLWKLSLPIWAICYSTTLWPEIGCVTNLVILAGILTEQDINGFLQIHFATALWIIQRLLVAG